MEVGEGDGGEEGREEELASEAPTGMWAVSLVARMQGLL